MGRSLLGDRLRWEMNELNMHGLHKGWDPKARFLGDLNPADKTISGAHSYLRITGAAAFGRTPDIHYTQSKRKPEDEIGHHHAQRNGRR